MPPNLSKCCPGPPTLQIAGYSDGDIIMNTCASLVPNPHGTPWDGTLAQFAGGHSCRYFGPRNQYAVDNMSKGSFLHIRCYRDPPIQDPHVPGQKHDSLGQWIFQILMFGAYAPPCSFGNQIIGYEAHCKNRYPLGRYIFVRGCAFSLPIFEMIE